MENKKPSFESIVDDAIRLLNRTKHLNLKLNDAKVNVTGGDVILYDGKREVAIFIPKYAFDGNADCAECQALDNRAKINKNGVDERLIPILRTAYVLYTRYWRAVGR